MTQNLPYKIRVAYYLGRKDENPTAEFWDRTICYFTNSRYSHVEVVYYFDETSGMGNCASSSVRDGGVRQASINLKSGKWEVYEVGTTKSVPEVIAWFDTHAGLKYDYIGALGAFFTPLNGNNRRYFCTEAVGESLGIAGADKMTPEEFWRYFNLLGQTRVI